MNFFEDEKSFDEWKEIFIKYKWHYVSMVIGIAIGVLLSFMLR